MAFYEVFPTKEEKFGKITSRVIFRKMPVSCPEPKAKAQRGLRSVSDEEV